MSVPQLSAGQEETPNTPGDNLISKFELGHNLSGFVNVTIAKSFI
jgi:hypothetical protein